jgi:hypothetical protein
VGVAVVKFGHGVGPVLLVREVQRTGAEPCSAKSPTSSSPTYWE